MLAPITVNRQPSAFIIGESEFVTPFMQGVLDAEQGNVCVPEMYYVRRVEKCEYCEGYESVAGKNLTTGFYLGHEFHVGMSVNWTPFGECGREATVVEDLFPAPGDKRICIEYQGKDGMYYRKVRRSQLTPLYDTDEQRDYRADQEFWARGQW